MQRIIFGEIMDDHALMFDNLMALKAIENNFILSTPNETIHFMLIVCALISL